MIRNYMEFFNMLKIKIKTKEIFFKLFFEPVLTLKIKLPSICKLNLTKTNKLRCYYFVLFSFELLDFIVIITNKFYESILCLFMSYKLYLINIIVFNA